MPLPAKPLTRTEQYLSNIAGENNAIPTKPFTRIEQYLDYIAKNGGGGGGGGSITIDPVPTQGSENAVSSGGVYEAIQAVSSVTEVTVSGTDPVIQADANTRYVCGTVTSLSFTPSQAGLCEVIFTAGSTVPVLTLPNTVKMPEWFEGLEAGYTYEISVYDGVYGAVMSWPV